MAVAGWCMWLGTADTLRLRREERRAIQQYHQLLTPALVRRLNGSLQVRYALDKEHPALPPQWSADG